jgi:hypothetical protein
MTHELKDPETDDDKTRALDLRNPRVPVTITDLASLKTGEALSIIEAREKIISAARRASIRLTFPTDWLLFRTRDGNVTAYLDDAGCERIRGPIWGIQIYDIGTMDRIDGQDPDDFCYAIRVNGRCGLTGEIVEGKVGIRHSKEDFVKDLTGALREARVQQAARANGDGGVVRELTGMASVPLQELSEGWAGTWKTVEQCPLGRGFGTRDERLGGGERPGADLEPPVCKHCNTPMDLKKGSKGYFYSCKNRDQHGNKQYTVDLETWKKDPRSKPKQAADAPHAVEKEPPANHRVETKPPSPVKPLHADEIDFGGGRRTREPGEEG